ncbi:MAG: DUF1549 domain-containing protein, partial [Bacteroidota bacterium]
RRRSHNPYRSAVNLILAVGDISAVLSAVAGWLLAASDDYGAGLVDQHRWTAVATAAISCMAWIASWRTNRNLVWALLMLASAGVTITGHLGALITHGEDYWSPSSSGNETAFVLSGDPDERMEQNVRLRAILAHHCYSCHGPAKVKGKLRMDSREALFAGGKHGPVIIPGNAATSELIRRVRLPAGHREAMPSKGTRLTEPDIRFIESWINAGAPWPEGKLKSIYRTANILPRLPQLPDTDGHPVDRWVDRYFSDRKISWPDRIDDRLFIRRVYFDIIGLPPAADSIDAFIQNQDPEKRIRLADRLLQRNTDYAKHWLTFWNDALRNDYTGTGYITGGRTDITAWLYQSLAGNKSYDLMIRELIHQVKGSEGFIRGIQWRGVVNASQRTEMQAAQNVAQVFMGLNLKCASCHDSFISDWKLDDAYAFANQFADSPLEISRCDKPTGRYAGYKMLYEELGTVSANLPKGERLRQLADSLVQFRNGRLARTMVNRIWAQLMGRGLVEPTDAMDNEPWSQDLLDWLAWDFAKNGYDIRRLIRTVVTSETYRLKSVAVKEPEDLLSAGWQFNGMIRRRLSAEQFADAVAVSVGPLFPDSLVPKKMFPPELGVSVVRASLVPNEPFLKAMGRPGRETVVTSRGHQAGLIQALELTNGGRFSQALKKAAVDWVKRYPSREQFMVQAYRKVLGRDPSADERKITLQSIGARLTADGAEDVLWALTLHPEFQLIY